MRFPGYRLTGHLLRMRIEELLMDEKELVEIIKKDIKNITNFINVCRLSGNYYDRRKTGKSDQKYMITSI